MALVGSSKSVILDAKEENLNEDGFRATEAELELGLE